MKEKIEIIKSDIFGYSIKVNGETIADCLAADEIPSKGEILKLYREIFLEEKPVKDAGLVCGDEW